MEELRIGVIVNQMVVAVRRFLLLMLVLVGIASSGFGVYLYAAPMFKPSSTELVPFLAPPASSSAAPETSASPEQPVLQNVGLFKPVSLDVYTPKGRLNPEPVTIYQGELKATAMGVNPPDQPAVLTDPATTLPGTGQGTVVITGHAQINPPKVFNFLSDLTPADIDGGTQVILYGPSGQELVYSVSEIRLIEKTEFETYAEFRDRTPNRLLIITCNLANGRDTTQNRVLVAWLVSSKLA